MVKASLPKKRTTFFLEPNIHETFKKICNREGESMSSKIERYMEHYNSVHMEGNPQLLLETFSGPLLYTCFKCRLKFPWLHDVRFISSLRAYVCDDCLKFYEKKGLVKKVFGIIGRKK